MTKKKAKKKVKAKRRQLYLSRDLWMNGDAGQLCLWPKKPEQYSEGEKDVGYRMKNHYVPGSVDTRVPIWFAEMFGNLVKPGECIPVNVTVEGV